MQGGRPRKQIDPTAGEKISVDLSGGQQSSDGRRLTKSSVWLWSCVKTTPRTSSSLASRKVENFPVQAFPHPNTKEHPRILSSCSEKFRCMSHESLDNQNVPQENTHPNFGHPSDGHPSDGHDFEAQGARVGILDGPKNSDPPSVKDGWSFDQVFSERVGVYFTNVFRVWVCLSYQPT